MALLSKFQDSEAVLLKNWDCPEVKTRQISSFLQRLGLHGKTVLLTTEGVNQNVFKSARNIQGVMVLPGADLNAFALLRQRHLVITVAELSRILGRQS